MGLPFRPLQLGDDYFFRMYFTKRFSDTGGQSRDRRVDLLRRTLSLGVNYRWQRDCNDKQSRGNSEGSSTANCQSDSL
jgi:hypothetical protein